LDSSGQILLITENEVTVIDNLSTGKLDNIKHLNQQNVSRARTFGFESESDFKEELKETIRWFSN
jgi:UDP-3-O-acyl-N-acetylglucosamine deacetylase